MAGTFTAIPVGQGDAFLLRRANRKTILVDGGRYERPFPLQLSSYLKSDILDIAICTHADSDHVNGLIGLFTTNVVNVRELWLPGRWLSKLGDLCSAPRRFLSALHEDIESQVFPSLDPLEVRRTPVEFSDVENVDIEQLTSEICLVTDDTDCLLKRSRGMYIYGDASCSHHQVFLQALSIADRIRKLAIAAYRRRVLIRWFDYDEAQRLGGPSGGNPQDLIPLNSKELIGNSRAPQITPLEWLRLTMANRESLVFSALADDHNSQVVFSADSDLVGCCLPDPTGRMPIITAPHHGAESSADAYDTAKNWCSSPFWVRSDRRDPTRPGQSYLSQRYRACTICRQSQYPKKSVQLLDTVDGWRLEPNCVPCHCR